MGEEATGRHSARWRQWRAEIDIDAYEERFQRMAAAGQHVHGEADLIESLGCSPVLDAGCGTGRVAIELARRGVEVIGVDLDDDMLDVARRNAPDLVWICDDLARMQLARRFPLVAMPGNVMIFVEPADRRLTVHNLVAHLDPGGLLLAGFSLEPGGLGVDEYDELCAACGLELVDRWAGWDRAPFEPTSGYQLSLHRRVDRFTVHDLVAEARTTVGRLTPRELHRLLVDAQDVTVIDTRTPTDRAATGIIAGSVHMPRTTVEWRCDPASGYSHPAVTSFDQRLVLVCNDGYSSSLAAATLQRLGFTEVADLVGGIAAWRRAGLPLVAPEQ